MKVTLCRDLTILFIMLAMVTHSSAADAMLEDEDKPVSDHKDDTTELQTDESIDGPPVLRKRQYKATPFGEIKDVVVLADILEEEDVRFLPLSMDYDYDFVVGPYPGDSSYPSGPSYGGGIGGGGNGGDGDSYYSQDPSHPFRLGMYWEQGYFWQESYLEKRYCAQCTRNCRHGDSLWIQDCNSRSSRQYFVKVGNTLRPNNNQRVCVTRTEDRKIHLYKCVGSTRQEWNGIDFGSKFELTAGQSNEKCLSQHHQPKENEVLFMEKCVPSRLEKSSYWITRYDDDGEEGEEDYFNEDGEVAKQITRNSNPGKSGVYSFEVFYSKR